MFNIMDEFPNNYSEQEKPDKIECVLYEFIYITPQKIQTSDKNQIGGLLVDKKMGRYERKELQKGKKKLWG